jgi:hypothetical protein
VDFHGAGQGHKTHSIVKGGKNNDYNGLIKNLNVTNDYCSALFRVVNCHALQRVGSEEQSRL